MNGCLSTDAERTELTSPLAAINEEDNQLDAIKEQANQLDAVVEGLATHELNAGQSLLATEAESRDDMEAILVTCPTDKELNLFVVSIPGG